MDNFKKYQKPEAPKDMVRATTYITRYQHEFIKKNNLNYSILVRDLLSDFILKQTQKEKAG